MQSFCIIFVPQFSVCRPHRQTSSRLRSQKQLDAEIDRKLNGYHNVGHRNVIGMDRESKYRHDRWCKAMCAVFAAQRNRGSTADYLHCGNADRLQITWSSADILKLKPLEIVDAVFDFFGDFNQSLDSISFELSQPITDSLDFLCILALSKWFFLCFQSAPI